MKQNKLTINTNFTIAEYVMITEAIVAGYFDDDGEYKPYIGELNAMRLFYNNCVESDINGLAHEIEKADEMVDLVNDETFIREFNKSIEYCDGIKLDFSNAFRNALDIIASKQKSLDFIIKPLTSYISGIVADLGSILNQDNIDKMTTISEGVLNGNLNVDAVVDAFKKTVKGKDVEKK